MLDARRFCQDFRAIVEANRDRVALVRANDGREYTYGTLGNLVARVATALRRRIPAGGAIVVAMPNAVETLVVFLGALEAGIDYAPLPPTASCVEAERLMSVVTPVMAVVADGLEPSLMSILRHCPNGTFDVSLSGDFDWLDPCSVADIQALAPPSRLFLSTSGSTGQPKAMVIDSDVLWNSGRAFIAQFQFVTSESRFFNCLPMHYMAGLYNLCLIPLSQGASVVVSEAFSARMMLTFWHSIRQHRVTVLWLVPTIVRGLLRLAARADSGSREGTAEIVAAFLGTAPIDVATKVRFEETFGIPLLENYALSETLFISSEMPGVNNRQTETVGRPLPFVSVRLGDAHAELDVSEPQPIFVKTPFLMLGYLGENGSIDLLRDEWFPTGDLGRFNDDGDLILEGRTRDIVKKGGVMIALREVECIVETHPAIREAVAFPIPHQDYGEDYVLLVDTDVSRTEVAEWVRDRISLQKRPGDIAVQSDFPRTASGKVKKHVLAQDWLLAKSTNSDGRGT